MEKFPFISQSYPGECGPACIQMIASFYDKNSSPNAGIPHAAGKGGMTMLQMIEVAEGLGFKANTFMLECQYLTQCNLPVILHWDTTHYVVLYDILNKEYHIADPEKGLLQISKKELLKHWCVEPENEAGIVLLLSDT